MTMITRAPKKGIDYRFVETDEDGILAPFGKAKAPGRRRRRVAAARRPRAPEARAAGLVACRQLLDPALKDG